MRRSAYTSFKGTPLLRTRTTALTAALLAVFSTSASAAIVWRGDYSTGDRSQWSGVEGLTSRITVQQSTVRPGTSYAARVELRNGDYASGGCRNELVRDPPITEGTEHYYAWSTQFDGSYPSNNTWQVFTQWHHSGSNGSPPVEMDVQGENISLIVHGDHILWYAPLVRGVWHDFVVHALWSSDASVGYLELWYDGRKVMDKNYEQTLYPGQYVYLKQGLYRDASIQQTAVVFHDGTVIGTTLADVAPQLVTPPPPPSPDAGTAPDAGAPLDAGSPDPSPDAGSSADAGNTTDAGSKTTADAGTTSTGDAGATLGPDAGTPPEPRQPAVASSPLGYPSGGCSSRGGTGSIGFLVVALGALLFLKRRRA